MESIKHNYSDVLNDRLNPVLMKTDIPMLINLRENAKPLKVMAARRVPKRYEEPAEAAAFVAKSDGRVRLVTDFTHLNRHVNRPVHPFLSTRDILQAIPHDAVYFMKMDSVHGYFQLALAEESSFLTTFLLQQGKFRYLRAPMGLNSSSDEWCCHSDRIITGLPWAKKIVDDTLIWVPNLEELK